GVITGVGSGVTTGVGSGVTTGVGSGVTTGVGSGVTTGVGVGFASVQLSELVLLEEIAVVPSSLTANTTRMPPWLVVNAWVTEIDQLIVEPLVLFAPVNVIVASFFVTFPAGEALDPLFGTM